MRKKILRSRSGFEKPESREEAIMQNILGASNVLEPSESNIEEILKSILYITPYTKEAEFEIEKILLAIKNNGTYDGEHESRDLKILFAILNDLDYTEEAESRIEELFIEWLHQRSSIKVLEGIPPLTFTSRGLPLFNYLIEGNAVQNGGVGERTGNLFDTVNFENAYPALFDISGSIVRINTTAGRQALYSDGLEFAVQAPFSISFNGESTNNAATNGRFRLQFDDDSYEEVQITKSDGSSNQYVSATFNKNLKRIKFNWSSFNEGMAFKNLMLNSGSTALPYEPYGYKIQITCGGVTTDIYIGDSPLYDGDTISMTDTGIEIPTAYGNNVLTVDTTVQPSNVYIEYK